MKDIEDSIFRRISACGKEWCFTPNDFVDLGGTTAVWTALHRLTRRGAIRRLAQGLYDLPRTHAEIGILSPSPEAVADAIARSRSIRIQPSGAYAANLSGLSEQVPARIVFLTDGASRRVRYGKQEIVLRRTTPRNMSTAGRISGTIIQALRHIGKDRVTLAHRQLLRRKLNAAEKKQLIADRRFAPGWMRQFLDEIAMEKTSHA